MLLDRTEEEIRRLKNHCSYLEDQTAAWEIELKEKKTALLNEKNEALRVEDIYKLLEQYVFYFIFSY